MVIKREGKEEDICNVFSPMNKGEKLEKA